MNRLNLPFLFLFLVSLLSGIVPGIAQGVKGGDTRRHSISLTKKRPVTHLPTGRILLIGNPLTYSEETEVSALHQLISSLPGYTPVYLSFREIRKIREELNETDLVWIHMADSADLTREACGRTFIRLIGGYLKEGGSLLLTLEGVRLLNTFGLEEKPIESKWKSTKDEGYGRKLGFHAFREHPLFSGLHGGAYILAPSADTAVRIHGFFGETLPTAGNVVAIDWDYIFFRENAKLILEYSTGKAKILAIGAYTQFSWYNANQKHLETFIRNTLDYMTGKVNEKPIRYWEYTDPQVIECKNSQPELNQHAAVTLPSSDWHIPESDLSFPIVPATANYCEVAGERILIMASEQAGLEEVWTHPFMSIRDFGAALIFSTSDTLWLSDIPSRIEIRPDAFIRYYLLGTDTLKEVVTADPTRPTGVIHYEYTGNQIIELMIRFKSNLRFMWPYSAQSICTICYRWDPDLYGVEIADGSGDFFAMVGGNESPLSHQMEADSGFSLNVTLNYSLQKGDPLDMVIVGTNEGRETGIAHFNEGIRDPQAVFQRSSEHCKNLINKMLMITSPDTNFNRGYRWALLGTDRFFVHTPGMGTALVAGYATTRHGWNGGQMVSGRPGYAWYFGRDGQWSGFAVLDYGDLNHVKQNLEFFLRFQDLTGKIFHEATTSGVIHYDAADATPLFLVLAGKYFRHSGDTAFIRLHWASIKKAIDFCFLTDTDGDHFIENTHVGHGWVEGGSLFGCHSTLYLQGCWLAALREAKTMADAMNDPNSQIYLMEGKEVFRRINEKFWNNQSKHYGYGINKNGSLRNDITILPSVPAYFGALDENRMDRVLYPYATNGFSTNWGVRILDETNPLFKPTGYHYGSVWPLFTGWASLAEYKYKRGIQGFTHIMNNLNVYRDWGKGFVEEVLNGATYNPSGVCSHQCWSETMVVQPIIEGMLGIDVMAQNQKIRLSPQLPADWDSLVIERIRMGNNYLDVRYDRDSIACFWQFHPDTDAGWKISFMPVLPPGTQIESLSLDGKEIPFTVFTSPRSRSVYVDLSIHGPSVLRIQYRSGISVLPLYGLPQINAQPEGTRILDASLQNNTYIIEMEGLSGSSDTISVWHASSGISSVQNGTMLDQRNQTTKILVDFPDSDKKYSYQSVILNVEP